MAGIYQRIVDPNFGAPTRGGIGSNAGIGAPGAAGLPPQQQDDFDPNNLGGLLGLFPKKEPEKAPAPAAEPGMNPIGNGGNFDMAPAMAGTIPNGGNFAMPVAGSGENFQLGGTGTATPMSNFGSGVPQITNPVAGMMPESIGGSGIAGFGTTPEPGMLQQAWNGILGFFGSGA